MTSGPTNTLKCKLSDQTDQVIWTSSPDQRTKRTTPYRVVRWSGRSAREKKPPFPLSRLEPILQKAPMTDRSVLIAALIREYRNALLCTQEPPAPNYRGRRADAGELRGEGAGQKSTPNDFETGAAPSHA